jgi:RimJ/RimL family protein N-acetyltransferase
MIRTARLALQDSGQSGSWQIVETATGLRVGSIGFFGIDRDRLIVGYEIVNERRNHGFATEALRAILQQTPRTVIAETEADHIASRRVMEKAGMHLERMDGSRVVYTTQLTS